MSLRVKPRQNRLIATLMTIMSVFAFVLSPFYGIVADQVASAVASSAPVTKSDDALHVTLSCNADHTVKVYANVDGSEVKNLVWGKVKYTAGYQTETHDIDYNDTNENWTYDTSEYEVKNFSLSAHVYGFFTDTQYKVSDMALNCDTTPAAPSNPHFTQAGTTITQTNHTGGPLWFEFGQSNAASGIAHYQVVGTAGNGSPLDSQSSIPGSQLHRNMSLVHGDGEYILKVRAVSNTGLTSDWSNEVTLLYDSTAPTLTIDTPTASGSEHTNIVHSNAYPITVSGDISDAGVGVDKVNLQVLYKDGSTWHTNVKNLVDTTVSSGKWSVEIPVNTLPDGVVAGIYASAKDKLDNEAKAQKYFKVDNEAPMPATDLRVNGEVGPYYVNSASKQLLRTWTASVSDEDIDHYVYHSYTSEQAANNKVGGWTKSVGLDTHIGGTTSRSFWWRVSAVDKAGNESWSDTYSVIYDDIAPTIESVSPSDGSYINAESDLRIDFKVSDNVKMPKSQYVHYYLQDEDGNKTFSAGTTFKRSNTDESHATSLGGYIPASWLKMLKDGEVTLHVGDARQSNWLKDAAGNKYDRSHVVATYILDKTKPHVFSIFPSYVTSTDPILNITSAHDNVGGSGLDYIRYSIKSTDPQYQQAVTGSSTSNRVLMNVDIDASLLGTNGAYDTAAGINGIAKPTNDKWAKFFHEGSDGKYYINDGSYVISVQAFDKAGHKSGSNTHKFVVDNTAPEVTINGYTGDDRTPTLTGEVTNFASNPDVKVVVSLDNGETGSATVNPDGTWTYDVRNTLAFGSTTLVTVLASDDAGNQFSTTADVVVDEQQQQGGESGPTGGDGTTAGGNVVVTPNNDGQVLSDNTDGTDEDDTAESEVKADTAETAAGVEGDETEGCFTLLGLCWYYWIPIVIVAIGIIWWLSARGRNRETTA